MDSGFFASLSPGMTQIGTDTDGKHQRRHGERAPRSDRSRHDGLQGSAHRERRQSRSRGRLAAQEGAVQGGQEGRARRRRRLDRRCRQREQRRRRRGEFRDRFRRPQRSVPGSGEDDRQCRARHRSRRRQDPGGKSRLHHHRRSHCRHHRQDRREHDAAPRRRACGRQGRRRQLRAQLGRRRPRQDRRAGRAGIDRKCRRAQGLRPAAGDACLVCQPAGHRSVRSRSGNRSSAKRACSPPKRRASRPTLSRRSSSSG